MRSFKALLKRTNERIALILSDSLSSMACFWVITVLVLAVLRFQVPGSPLEWIQYAVQTFFQGVALPVLAFVSKKEGDKSRKMNSETHDTVMNELGEMRAIQKINTETHETVLSELQELKAVHTDILAAINKPRCAELIGKGEKKK